MSSNEKPEGPTPGYYRKPHQLRTDTIDLDGTTYKFVDFIADLTLGWGSRWVILSQDEIINGKRRPNGEHMPDLRSGLKEKKSIKKAIDTALELGLIEVRYTRWGTAYAIHHRYWGLMPFAPKWEIFGFIYHDPETDPIPDLSPGGLNPPNDEKNLEIESATGVWNPPGNNTESTSQYYSTHQTVILKQPAESREAASGEARDKGKDTSLNTSLKDRIGKDTLRAPEVARPSGNLEKEEEQTKTDPSPSQPTGDTIPNRVAGPSAEELAARAEAQALAERKRAAEAKAQRRSALEGERTYFEQGLARVWKQLQQVRVESRDRRKIEAWQEEVNHYSGELSRVLQELEG